MYCGHVDNYDVFISRLKAIGRLYSAVQLLAARNCLSDIRTILLSEAWSLQKGDFTVSIQIFLISTQYDHYVLAGQHPGICQPGGQSVVCFSTNIRRQKTTHLTIYKYTSWYSSR